MAKKKISFQHLKCEYFLVFLIFYDSKVKVSCSLCMNWLLTFKQLFSLLPSGLILYVQGMFYSVKSWSKLSQLLRCWKQGKYTKISLNEKYVTVSTCWHNMTVILYNDHNYGKRKGTNQAFVWMDGFINGWSSLMLLLTSCRDPADNAPAPPDWRTPSYCANLQAPRDTWVQLRTASLVEPTHHVSVCPPAARFEMLLTTPIFCPPSVPSTSTSPSSFSFLFFFFLFLCCLSDLNKLCRLTFLSPVIPPKSVAVLNQSTNVYLCSSFPTRSGVHHRMQLLKSYTGSHW